MSADFCPPPPIHAFVGRASRRGAEIHQHWAENSHVNLPLPKILEEDIGPMRRYPREWEKAWSRRITKDQRGRYFALTVSFPNSGSHTFLSRLVFFEHVLKKQKKLYKYIKYIFTALARSNCINSIQVQRFGTVTIWLGAKTTSVVLVRNRLKNCDTFGSSREY